MSEATIEDADFEPVEEATHKAPRKGYGKRLAELGSDAGGLFVQFSDDLRNGALYIGSGIEKAGTALKASRENIAQSWKNRSTRKAASDKSDPGQSYYESIARPKAKSSFSFVDFLRDIFTSSKAKAARREARREAKTLELLEAREKFFKRDDVFFENGPKTPEVNGQDSWHAKSAQKRAVRHAEAAQKEASKGATTRRFFANKNISADAYLDAVRLKRASTPTKVAAGVAAAFAAAEVADEVSSLAHTYKRAVPVEDVHISPEVTEEEPLLSREELDALLREDPDYEQVITETAEAAAYSQAWMDFVEAKALSDLEFNADGSVSTDLVLAKDLVKDLADVSETPYLNRLEELASDDQSHALVKRMAASALCKATQLKDSNTGEKGVQMAEELAEKSIALFPKYIKRYEFLRFKKENPVTSNSPDAVYVANLFAEEAKKPKAIEAAPAQSAGEPEWEVVPEAEQKLLENKFPNRLGKGIAPSDLG